jgi:hypothetical protein
VIALVERSIGLFERLGGLDQRDQLLFKTSSAATSSLPVQDCCTGTPADDELTLSDVWLEVFQEVLPRAKYRSAGMLVAEAYRTDFGQEPPLPQQFVDGAPRQVKRFRAQLAGG